MPEIYDAYLAKFGKHPEIFVGDVPEDVEAALRKALETGKPWVRKPSEQEGVR